MKTLCVHIALIALLWQVTFFSVFCIFLEYNRGDIAEEYCINRFDESSMCVGSCYIATQTVDTFEQQQSDRSSLPLVDIEIMPFSLFCDFFLSIRSFLSHMGLFEAISRHFIHKKL